MSDSVDLRLLGEQVQRLQREVRDVRERVEYVATSLPGQFNVAIMHQTATLVTRLADLMAEQAAANDRRFDGIDQRFTAMDQRLDGIDQRFTAIDQRFDRIELLLERLAARP